MTRKEWKAVKSLWLNKDIKILEAEENHCSAVSVVQRPVKDFARAPAERATVKAERKVQKILAEHRVVLPTDLNTD